MIDRLSRRTAIPVAAAAAVAFHCGIATAQQTTPPPAAVSSYHAPVLAMVEPANGGAVPADRPMVVFRFAPGEADDPLDLRSFAVSVDGQDRSALFQVTASEAWGPLAGSGSGDAQAAGLSPGAHRVDARLCSSRGACATVSLTVTADASPAAAPPAPGSGSHSILGLLLALARKLLIP